MKIVWEPVLSGTPAGMTWEAAKGTGKPTAVFCDGASRVSVEFATVGDARDVCCLGIHAAVVISQAVAAQQGQRQASALLVGMDGRPVGVPRG